MEKKEPKNEAPDYNEPPYLSESGRGVYYPSGDSKPNLLQARPPEFELTKDYVDRNCSSYGPCPALGYYKVYPDAFAPKKATEGSACYDLFACLIPLHKIKYHNNYNELNEELVPHERTIDINPYRRYLIPTQLIFDIPAGYQFRLYPRSGLAWKNGITLSNCVGIIDCDYVDPTFVMLVNTTAMPCTIKHGDRICQGELVESIYTQIQQVTERPKAKTTRSGGFGSTGT